MKTSNLKNNLVFMVKLTTVCMLFVLLARTMIGERAELSVYTANGALRLIRLSPPISQQETLKTFSDNFLQKHRGNFKLWHSKKEDNLWLCEATGAGMWGNITALILFHTDSWLIKGLRVIEQKETPGIGSRITDEEFYEKFDNLNCATGVQLAKIKIKNNEFDAISGATESCKAMENIINKALEILKEKLVEEKNEKS